MCQPDFSVKLTEKPDRGMKVWHCICYTLGNRDDQMTIISLRPVQTGGLGSVFFFVSARDFPLSSFQDNQQGSKSKRDFFLFIGYWLLGIDGYHYRKLLLSFWKQFRLQIQLKITNKEVKVKGPSCFSLDIGYWVLIAIIIAYYAYPFGNSPDSKYN